MNARCDRWPVLVDQNPHCSASDKTAKTCTPHSGYGTMSSVLSMLDAFREANGVEDASTWYADFTVGLGGGLSGGERGTGDNAELVMNHELGHAWGFPHWSTSDAAYPYEGVHANVSGGFGDRWAFDQARNALLAPTCSDMERQSPMQRSGGSCVPDGSWYDPYSDYEAARLLRVSLGGSAAVMGTVAYHGGKPELKLGDTRAFTLPKKEGRLAMRFDASGPGFTWARYDEASYAFTASTQDAWYAVAASEVPVTMFAGALLFGGDSYFEAPTDYIGNVLGALDSTKDADFATIKKHMSDDFYWAHDAVLLLYAGRPDHADAHLERQQRAARGRRHAVLRAEPACGGRSSRGRARGLGPAARTVRRVVAPHRQRFGGDLPVQSEGARNLEAPLT